MRYNYGAILSYSPKWIMSASNYFFSENTDLINILSDIEDKQKLIQQKFDIFNPNIDFSIGEYVFNKEGYVLTIGDNISLIGNNLPFLFLPPSGDVGVYYDNTVAHIDRAEESTTYTDEFFLSRDVFTHNVTWLYDTSSAGLAFPEGHMFNPSDILPYTYASSIFYRKVEENFSELLILSHDTGKDKSIVSKEIAVRELNGRYSSAVECNPDNIIGSSIQIYGDDVFLSESIDMNIGFFSFFNDYIYTDKSPIGYDYMDSNFLKIDLSNTDKFIILEQPISDRDSHEIISDTNFSEITEYLLPLATEEIDDSYAIFRSGGRNALNFKMLHMILTEKLSQFYAVQLKLFLDGYDGAGALGELIKYIQDKIKELQDKYIFNDECKLTPLDNVDEGCNMECANIALDEPKLMVTKQKLKAIIRCSMTCEGVL